MWLSCDLSLKRTFFLSFTLSVVIVFFSFTCWDFSNLLVPHIPSSFLLPCCCTLTSGSGWWEQTAVVASLPALCSGKAVRASYERKWGGCPMILPCVECVCVCVHVLVWWLRNGFVWRKPQWTPLGVFFCVCFNCQGTDLYGWNDSCVRYAEVLYSKGGGV